VRFLLETVRQLREDPEKPIDARLLLVPRHMERRGAVMSELAACEGGPVSTHLRSSAREAPEGTVVYIADTTGEMTRLMQVADLAFIGKSLSPNRGGQTPVEAAALGQAMVYGPNMANFRSICAGLEGAGGVCKGECAADVRKHLCRLAHDPQERHLMGERAKTWHRSQRGAARRMAESLRALATRGRGLDA